MKKRKRQFLSLLIIIISLMVIVTSWILIFKAKKVNNKSSDERKSLVARTVPYFLLAVDVSGSMKKSDPANFEAEALKNLIRTIYYNGKSLNNLSEKPRIQIITFSGDINFVTPPNKWITLNSENDILQLDKRITKTLSNRIGNYTDFNKVAQYLIESNKTITSDKKNLMIVNLFTDGEFYPDCRNQINHRNKEEYNSYLSSLNLLLKKGESYFTINEKLCINNKEKFKYAKDTIQIKLKDKIIQQNNPLIQLNVIKLSNTNMEYLKKWTKNIGELFIINKPLDIGKAFFDIMSKNLDAGFEYGHSNNGTIKLNPFTKDIIASEFVIFGNNVNLISTNMIKSRLNKNLKLSKMYFFDDKYENFYNKEGLKFNLNTTNVDWFLITIHDNYLDMETDTLSLNQNKSVYRLSLKSEKDNKVLKNYSKPLKLKMITSNNNLINLKLTDIDEFGYIKADFSDCKEGKYLVQFQINGGQLENDSYPLRKRIFSFNVIVNPRVIIYDKKNKKPIDKIIFSPLDRE